jgi:xylan 1,4-beta-xylosidase
MMLRVQTKLTLLLGLMVSAGAAPSEVQTPSSATALDPTSPGISIDLARPTTLLSATPTFSVGSDRALIFTHDEHQRQLKTLQDSVHFRYLRCHGIFNEEMKIVSRLSDGSLIFDWTRVDRFIDRLKEVRLRPFVECGFMPEALASGKQTIFWWRGNVTPPRNYNEWSQLIRAFARHEIDKRGLPEVRNWYFEVWNEPNLSGFWTGGQDGYFHLYETTARALKDEDSKIRVGGPSTAGMGWIPELLTFCKERKVPIDFISSHSYAATEGFLDEKGRGGTMLVTSPNALIEEFTRAREDIRKSAFPELPLFITEWGPSYSPRDPIHDSYVCAPFILEKVRQCENVVDGMSYWAFTDLFEEPGPPTGPLQGGFGLLNPDGLRKPAFFAYQFLGQLYPNEIPVASPRIIATRSGTNLRVVLWDYSPPKADRPNNPFYTEDLKPSALPDASLVFSGLSPGHYSVSRIGTGYRRNDVYAAYLDLGKPESTHAHLSKAVLDRLKAACAGSYEALPNIVVGKNGRAELRLPMRTNDVWFVELRKVR